MSQRSATVFSARPSAAYVLLMALLLVLWIAGGASRADTYGQIVVRFAAWLALVAGIITVERPVRSGSRAVTWLLAAAIGVAALQLIPLPPAVWQSLPGRAMFVDAATLSGQPQPWRPWTIVPDATWNALSSLIVPLTVLLLATRIRPSERATLPGVLLVLITASTLLGLVQFSGGSLSNPLVNDTPGEVSATFANRNHFALFVAFGCAVAPVWAFLHGRRAGWRGPVALGLLPLFVLIILASGSRAGMIVGLIGLAAGLIISWRPLKKEFGRYPRWVPFALVATLAITIVLLVGLSVAADRAASISRTLAVDTGQDMRQRALPTVLHMIGIYFPAGTGLGTFDPMFRIHEPFKLLKLTYFNHVHNDYLEIVLDAGIVGLVVLGAAVGWWLWATFVAWKGADRLARLGSAVLFQVLIASLVDYPARTPLIMASIIVAGLWLSGDGERERPALPTDESRL